MLKSVLSFTLLFSFSAVAGNDDCKIANQIFNDTGELIVLSTNAAKGADTDKLSKSKVTASDFNQWSNAVFSPKMNKVISKYSKYQSVNNNNPIYFGNVVIVETDNYLEALKNFTATHNKEYISSLKEIMGRVGKAHDSLKVMCSE